MSEATRKQWLDSIDYCYSGKGRSARRRIEEFTSQNRHPLVRKVVSTLTDMLLPSYPTELDCIMQSLDITIPPNRYVSIISQICYGALEQGVAEKVYHSLCAVAGECRQDIEAILGPHIVRTAPEENEIPQIGGANCCCQSYLWTADSAIQQSARSLRSPYAA